MTPFEALRMGCEYQPLICTHTLTAHGYEALARFHLPCGSPVAPNVVFDQFHQSPKTLARVEYLAKQLQLINAPQSGRLFINLDPHAVNQHNEEAMLTLLAQQPNLTAELIENTSISDAKLSAALLKKLQQQGNEVALDDIGAPHSMLSLQLLSEVDCFKFDMTWLDRSDCDSQHQLLITLIDYAKKMGKTTVMEGVELQSQLHYARDLGIDLVQGYLFKSQFVQGEQQLELTQLLAD
ncbi:EAL domain-containing protein [Ferrimonas lipolytica]|uniref:EAL domain-containing protein n=1 Tax=Ferrimonas lipolytica TaxID=2724191 RepID=A0A6H1UHU1_9GAMM|nr:EAL domain-containing protein [Ferrimonas lipolytica]QIZ77786.1 EAL domain-containing protein [Ferrimonas lipolytica]